MNSNLGCYHCQVRKAYCHSTCQDYREWKEKHDAKREEIRANKRREEEVTSVIVAAKIKTIKRRGERRIIKVGLYDG